MTTVGTGSTHILGYLGALFVGVIMLLYVMYGFDTVGSLVEEIDDFCRKVFWVVF